ncbi:hypothetical protein JTE90_014328 [Oedothorax gibbosus]|uniref:Uncharacterized protein n=1 Tax=Oedothorax gibbosus TaxID=931172 RepID=A0AAV6TTQ4_9ARAC|nr:hypothetical protein JTE90_014328 [Oedothorax gibbosus]
MGNRKCNKDHHSLLHEEPKVQTANSVNGRSYNPTRHHYPVGSIQETPSCFERRQVLVNPLDRNYQRILGLGSPVG